VVEKSGDCGGKPLAVLGPADPVRVFSVGGGTALPPGFSGVASVVAGSSGAGAAAAGAAAASGGGFLSSTAGLIVAGAAVVGVGIAVAAEENSPVSPTQ
jgi:hypothetical protein